MSKKKRGKTLLRLKTSADPKTFRGHAEMSLVAD